ncbi:MAG: membrane protein insertion efficiency factor YidD [Candidatus Pelagibacter sp. TMED153]|nr:MAG: membrane protein insertion efficiency factor YidD [Candidatus Pelagibacter sp. TMED153]|tara:strand:- start:994 stop:1263 length:270 start_codon:yes stop_codon:yes gene_type:complete
MSKIIIFIHISIIKFYQYLISPLLGSKCRYLPTCSEYYVQSLKIHGLIRGSYLGLKRIFSCHPFKILGGSSGLDFVPEKKKLTKEKTHG